MVLFEIDKNILNLRFGLSQKKAERDRGKFDRIYFSKDHVYSCDGRILFKGLKTTYLNAPEASRILTGRSIHYDTLAAIARAKTDKLYVTYNKLNQRVELYGSTSPEAAPIGFVEEYKTPPQFEEVIPSKYDLTGEHNQTAINPEQLYRLGKCFNDPHGIVLKLRFHQNPNRPILVTRANGEFDETGVILPASLI